MIGKMDRINRLLYLYMLGRLGNEEQAELQDWAEGSPERRELLRRLSDPAYVSRQLSRRALVSTSRPMADMQRRIGASRPRILWRVLSIAAAVAVVVICAATYYIYSGSDMSLPGTDSGLIAEEHTSDAGLSLDDIRPGTTHALLTSDAAGSAAIELGAVDTARVGSHIMLSQVLTDEKTDRVAELCLDVPRGNEFKIVLEDSTEVWLNSESTLRYPENFGPKERRVEITGEAYFAVHHEADRPFIVDTREQSIKVYGTTFNVRAYDEDSIVYTTLESGSIAISLRGNPSGEVMLSPGHQALLSRDYEKLHLRRVDPKVITSWRHGRFVFEEQMLSGIMRDLSRWYNFEYEFAHPELENIVFMGSIPRYADFATAIALIEESGGLRFKTEGRKVIVDRK